MLYCLIPPDLSVLWCEASAASAGIDCGGFWEPGDWQPAMTYCAGAATNNDQLRPVVSRQPRAAAAPAPDARSGRATTSILVTPLPTRAGKNLAAFPLNQRLHMIVGSVNRTIILHVSRISGHVIGGSV